MLPSDEASTAPDPKPGRGPKPASTNPFLQTFSDVAPAPSQSESRPRPELPKFDRLNITKLTPLSEAETYKPDSSESLSFAAPSMSIQGMPISLGPSSATIAENADPEDVSPQASAEKKPKQRRSYEMSVEDYNALTDKQRDAINFNTLLVEAREKDLNTEYKGSPQQPYIKAVERIFGEDGGSTVFAPETIAALTQIDFQAPKEGVGSDLDDFLGLKVAITEKDLANFNAPTTDIMSQLSGQLGSSPVQNDLVAGTNKLEAELEKSKLLLNDWRSAATRATGLEASQWFGGTPNAVIGYGDSEADVYFRQALDALNNPAIDTQQVMAMMNIDFGEGGKLAGLKEDFDLYLTTEMEKLAKPKRVKLKEQD